MAEVVFFHSAGFGGVGLRKGTDLVVRAFTGVTGRARLTIHSQVPMAHYGETADLIRSDPRISFIERTVPAPGLYHLGNVYVYPSRLEGIGLSVPEALSCGLPVITTDNPPMNEFVSDGVDGSLVPVAEYRPRHDNYYWPQSIVALDHLTQCMQEYVDNPASVIERGRNARRLAVERLDWAANAASLSETLARLDAPVPSRLPVPRLAAWVLTDAAIYSQHIVSTGISHALPTGLRRSISKTIRGLRARDKAAEAQK
ncbi:MAG: glycosyltransferase family 4 protein [Chloroflexi bacterium]|nr:glycosyltransferase family 4 protein [Chloroflexota bacterium]